MPTATPPTAPPSLTWELFFGTIQLVIVGPGPDAWLPVSKPEYRHRVKPGNENERSIARRTIEILKRDHPFDREAGPAVMAAAWRRAAVELGFNPDNPESI